MLIRLSENARLYHADCREAIRELPDNSIDSVVTDPPYALVSIVKRFGGANAAPAKGNDAYMRASAGFMGKQWDTGETAFSEEFWADVLRVLKPGGHVAAFGASRGYHRMACAIEDAGFEIRDSLMWVYGVGFPKSQNVAKFIDQKLGVTGSLGDKKANVHSRGDHVLPEGWHRPWMDDPDAVDASSREYHPGSPEAKKYDGFGTALKPSFEPIVLARKPLSESTVAANVLRWGTGALNIDGCRVASDTPVLSHGGVSKNRDVYRDGDFGKTYEGGGREYQSAGRWPANVVTDGSDEVVGAFPDSKGQQSAVTGREPSTSKETNGWGTIGRAPNGARVPRNDAGGSAARFFKSCPPDETERRFHYSAKASKADRNGSKHPTVKPIALMEWLATLITPPGGTILDPFAGSGTTGAAAVRNGFRCILCEREDEYVADIRRRLGSSDPLSTLLQWNERVRAFKAQGVAVAKGVAA